DGSARSGARHRVRPGWKPCRAIEDGWHGPGAGVAELVRAGSAPDDSGSATLRYPASGWGQPQGPADRLRDVPTRRTAAGIPRDLLDCRGALRAGGGERPGYASPAVAEPGVGALSTACNCSGVMLAPLQMSATRRP